MSAPTAGPGITDVPQRIYQPLPAVTADLFVIHYSSNPQAKSPHQTHPVSAIVAQHYLSGRRMTFAAFTVAEAAGIPASQFLKRFPQLEREMLTTFSDFTANHPSATWIHWGMRDAIFGFDVLAQRAAFYHVRAHWIQPESRFDLSHHLAQRFGDDFAPHPRLWHTVQHNLGAVPDMLDEKATVAAWQRGNHGADLWSLNAKVDAIARLFDRVRLDQFQTNSTDAYPHAACELTADGAASSVGSLTLTLKKATRRLPRHKKLTERQKLILTEMLAAEAVGNTRKTTRDAIVQRIDKSKTGPDFARDFGTLKDAKYTDSGAGPDGGVWLTATGKAKAEELRKENGQ